MNISQLSEALIAIDQDGMVFDFNQEAEAVFGLKARDVVGVHVASRFGQEFARAILPQYQNHDLPRNVRDFASRKDHSVVRVEKVSLGRPDGSLFSAELWITSVAIAGRTAVSVTVREIAGPTFKQRELYSVIRRAQSDYIDEGNVSQIFSRLLRDLVRLTNSEMGYLGEIVPSANRHATLKTQAFVAEEFSDKHPMNQSFGVNEDSLAVQITRLCETTANSGCPLFLDAKELWQPLNSFMGLPFYHGPEMVGVVGFLNRPGGFRDTNLEHLKPFLGTCGVLIKGAQADLQRRRAEAELDDFFKLSEHFHCIFNFDSWFRRLNEKWSQSLGWTQEELKSRPFLDFVHPEDRSITAAEFARLAKTGRQTVAFENRYRCKNGSYRWLSWSAVPRLEQQLIFASAQDITDRKRIEQSLLDRELQLREMNAQLGRALRLKDEFMATMSHELRTPLNTVLGMCEALRLGTFGELETRQNEMLAIVEESGKHLYQLINDLLDLSKLEVGQLQLSLEELDVQKVCAACLRMVRESAHEKRIDLALQIDPSVNWIYADALRVKQILVNLLGNAIKFTPQGGAIGLQVYLDAPTDRIRFVVWDTGIGISNIDLPRLFLPFSQLDSGLSRRHPGTGLGLSLVKQLAELHGGSAHVESARGRGSRFSVSLPRGMAGERGSETMAPSEPIRDRIPLQNIRTNSSLILLADDNEPNAQLLQTFLESCGYRVRIARNGKDAIESSQRLRPDLVLMDIQMPEIDGLEAIRRLRNNGETANLKIIALTALAMPGDAKKCIEVGADKYMTKPTSLIELATTISHLLNPSEDNV